MTIAQAFHQFSEALTTRYESGEAQSIARIVFEDEFSIRNPGRHDHLASYQLARLARIQSKLLRGEPIQYVLGQADFYGLKFDVNPHVLIPRQETEELVHWILETPPAYISAATSRLLDIGTGSGCIAITLATERSELEVWAIDHSADALSVAQENAATHRMDIRFEKVDILDPAQWTRLPDFDLIVSNPPYIPGKEAYLMPENVKKFEPAEALFVPDEDPLLFYRKVIEFSDSHLRPGGWLFFEVNEFHASGVLKYLQQAGLENCEIRKDMQGKDRMARGRKSA